MIAPKEAEERTSSRVDFRSRRDAETRRNSKERGSQRLCAPARKRDYISGSDGARVVDRAETLRRRGGFCSSMSSRITISRPWNMPIFRIPRAAPLNPEEIREKGVPSASAPLRENGTILLYPIRSPRLPSPVSQSVKAGANPSGVPRNRCPPLVPGSAGLPARRHLRRC